MAWFFVCFIVTLSSLFRHYLTRIWTTLRISSSYFISLLSCYSSKLFVTRVLTLREQVSLLRFSIVDLRPRFVILIHWFSRILIIYILPCTFMTLYPFKIDLPFLFFVSFLYTIKIIYPFVTFSLLLLTMARRRRNFVFETRKYLIFVSTYWRRKILRI